MSKQSPAARTRSTKVTERQALPEPTQEQIQAAALQLPERAHSPFAMPFGFPKALCVSNESTQSERLELAGFMLYTVGRLIDNYIYDDESDSLAGDIVNSVAYLTAISKALIGSVHLPKESA